VQVPLSASGARVRSSERQSAGRAPELRRPRKARQRPAQPRCPWGDECRSRAQRNVARRGARCQSNRVDDGSGRALPCTMMPFARACRSQVALDRPDGGPVGTTAAGQAAPRERGKVLETRDSPSVRRTCPRDSRRPSGCGKRLGSRTAISGCGLVQSEHHDDRLEGVVFERQPSASACSSSTRVHSRSPLARDIRQCQRYRPHNRGGGAVAGRTGWLNPAVTEVGPWSHTRAGMWMRASVSSGHG
jgi:hypothetical protein